MSFLFSVRMLLFLCFLWITVEADYKFERQSVYGLTELVEEFQVKVYSVLHFLL